MDPTTITVDAHVLLGSMRFASLTSRKVGTSYPVSQTLYYHRDRQGSVVATTTAGGATGVKLRYGPYGTLEKVVGASAANGDPCPPSTSSTTTTCPELGYSGALRLSGSLVYLNARVYDTALRRFLSADSVDLARYTYTGGDPANYTDPSGLTRNNEDVSAMVMSTYRFPDSNFWFGSGATYGANVGALHSTHWAVQALLEAILFGIPEDLHIYTEGDYTVSEGALRQCVLDDGSTQGVQLAAGGSYQAAGLVFGRGWVNAPLNAAEQVATAYALLASDPRMQAWYLNTWGVNPLAAPITVRYYDGGLTWRPLDVTAFINGFSAYASVVGYEITFLARGFATGLDREVTALLAHEMTHLAAGFTMIHDYDNPRGAYAAEAVAYRIYDDAHRVP